MEYTKELNNEKLRISDFIFSLGLKINKFLSYPKEAPIKPVREGIRLPKIAVPTFDGDPLKWMNFWEQFEISTHSKEQLTSAEKMAYLQDTLMGRPAERVIEGLAQMADKYKEAISCLQSRYNRTRLIHQAHVRAMLEATPLKNDSGKEIWRLHDIANQHTHALKAAKQVRMNHC